MVSRELQSWKALLYKLRLSTHKVCHNSMDTYLKPIELTVAAM